MSARPASRLVRRVVRIAGRIESHVDRSAAAALSRVGGRPCRRLRRRSWPRSAPIELHLSARASSPELVDAALDAAVQRGRGARSAPTSTAPTAATLEQVVGDLLVGAGAAHRRGGIVHGWTDHVASDRRAWQLALRRSIGHHVLERGEDRAARRAARVDRTRTAPSASRWRWRWPTAFASRADADVGVGVTGIAGPTAARRRSRSAWSSSRRSTASDRRCRTFRFYGEREQVKFQASQAALDMVRRLLS